MGDLYGRPRMSRGNPFAMHRQRVWETRAADPDLPDWLRVASLAYGKHRANGHAPFAAGALREALGTVDRQTGEIKPNANVSRAINTAVRYGFLSSRSKARCLVIPEHAVSGGLGNIHEKCREHA